MWHHERMRALRNDQWNKICDFLRDCPNVYVGSEEDCRRFIEGVLWISRTGAPWRDIPSKYGNWNSVYKRFARWCDQGIWERLFAHFSDDPDMEFLIIDSTVVRAHPCAAGASKKNGGQAEQALGRSRGGFSTKIHISVDGLGNPLRILLTAGQRHDISQADALIDGCNSEFVIGDKGYDSETFRQKIADQGAEPVIPPRKNKQVLEDYDHHLYKERHLVECCISKLKHYRRIFSRFEKLASRYVGFIQFVCALVWMN